MYYWETKEAKKGLHEKVDVHFLALRVDPHCSEAFHLQIHLHGSNFLDDTQIDTLNVFMLLVCHLWALDTHYTENIWASCSSHSQLRLNKVMCWLCVPSPMPETCISFPREKPLAVFI